MAGTFRSYGKIDPYVQMQFENKHRARKRCIVIAVSSIVLLVVVICLAVGVTRARKHSSEDTSGDGAFSQGSKAIQAACNTTVYPQVCMRDLSSYPGSLTANPRELVIIAMKIALQHVMDAYSVAQSLAAEQGKSILEDRAVQDCIDLMDGAEGHLNCSISRLSNLNLPDLQSFNETMLEVKVCLSSALSYQSACADGFENSTGSIPQVMLSKQEDVAEVIMNAFCLLDTLSLLGSDLSSWKNALPSIPKFHLRRLLSDESSSGSRTTDSLSSMTSFVDGFPEWVSAADRKLLQAPTSPVSADVTVARDDSGNYKTIKEALDNVPDTKDRRYVIYIKAGIYEEVFSITKGTTNITFVGDGIGITVITGSRNYAIANYPTYQTATVGISGPGFIARYITFQNTAGPEGHQAVAMRAGADLVVFDTCGFEGYQDTLYALSGRQFYRNCKIYGTVDYIFGNAIAVFQNCQLVARLPSQGQQNTYTAQGRKLSTDISGFSFQNCDLVADSVLESSTYPVLTYLGRPWKAYSRTVFLQSLMSGIIQPEGWLPWNTSNPFTETVFYGEFENRGPGSNTDQRVDWGGVRRALTLDEAMEFTVQKFISGTSWLPESDVLFDASLTQ